MYPRTYEFVQPNSYSYAPQNFPGALHYAYGYSQPRCTNYSTLLQPQVQQSRPQYLPPRLSHPTEQQSGHHRSQTEDRPSCMLQDVWRPNVSCSRSGREQYDQENDVESVEDSVTGNCREWFGFHAKFSTHRRVFKRNNLVKTTTETRYCVLGLPSATALVS